MTEEEEDDRKRKRRRGRRNTSTFLPSFVPTMSSVKVAVRVRPFNSREVQRNCKLAIEMRNTQTIISGGPKARRSFLPVPFSPFSFTATFFCTFSIYDLK